MYLLNIICTGKSYSPKDIYTRFMDDEITGLTDMKAVHAALDKRYGKSKRQKMYMERKDGTSYVCGWVIGFHNADYSHAPVNKWMQRDWVELIEYHSVNLDKAA